MPVSLKTMEMSTPYACAWMVFLLMLLYSLFIASLMLFLNLTAGNAAGVIGALLVNLYGYLLNPELLRKSFRYPGCAGLPGKRAVRVAVTASARHISDA